MTSNAPTILALLALFIAYILFRAASDVPRSLSPQGCRMSWMSPSYLLQSEFDTSWTPLASRYSLWLYREVGWEPNQVVGLPVLFIPGNAGSSHQVRSIASSAARQYFSSPFAVSHEFTTRHVKPLDFYAVEFNEDLSAFHGSTLDSQIAYASAAVEYILSRYPPATQVIVMGHSMGGIVGTALLPSENITALITMSTPHALPPARFDARIEEIYTQNEKALRDDKTPILSICGGATDVLIPSESCILPEASKGAYRRTLFTSALEGAWTGVGHREMVWCHQVRWRVARAALELSASRTAAADERARTLDRWLRDGRLLPPHDTIPSSTLKQGEYEVVSEDVQFVVNSPVGKRTYLLPIPNSGNEVDVWSFVLHVSHGSVSSVSPHHTPDLRVSVYHCMEHTADASISCDPLAPIALRLLPSPLPGKAFPAPDEGTDESEGLVYFEAKLPRGLEGWVGATVNASVDGRGWVAGGFDQPREVKANLNLRNLLFGPVEVLLPGPASWRTDISLPRLPATALLVYRLIPRVTTDLSCATSLFSPLLVHTSPIAELHYYRLESGRPVFLHTHSSAPYVPRLRPTPSYGLELTIHSSKAGCQDVIAVSLSVDWWASLGRLSTRYPTTLLSWGVGIVSLLLFRSWSPDGQQLSVQESLAVFVKYRMPALMVFAGLSGLLPFGPDYYLGIDDKLGVLRVALGVLVVGLATGMVCVSWWLLMAIMWPLRLLARLSIQRRREDVGVRRSTVVSMTLILVLILLLVPWQVAFLGCWIIQLLNCNAALKAQSYTSSVPILENMPTSSMPLCERGEDTPADCSNPSSTHSFTPVFVNAYSQNTHILLLMTWLLPLVAPVLAVWVRTIQTAGYTTPFNGDHNVLKVVPVLMLVDLLGRGRTLDVTATVWRFPARWGWIGVALIAFLVGGRRAYLIYHATCVQLAILLVCQMMVWLYR